MRYACLVKPGTTREEVIEDASGNLVVYLRAKPHDGEANEALVKLVAKHFRIPKTTIKIVSGQKSRNKVIEFS